MRARTTLRRFAGAAALSVAIAACGDDGRDRVRDYLTAANAVQRESAPSMKRANEAYAAYARDRAVGAPEVARLERAERAIAAARERTAAIDPPAETRKLHGRLLRVHDVNRMFARDTTALAHYQAGLRRALRPRDGADRSLRGLAGKVEPGGDQEALAGYAGALRAVVGRLRRLRPPAMMRTAHGAQLRRLERARALALDLRDAVGDRDSPRAARLLLRFRRLGARGDGGAAGRAAFAYQRRRLEQLRRATIALQREQGRLERDLR